MTIKVIYMLLQVMHLMNAIRMCRCEHTNEAMSTILTAWNGKALFD